MGKRKTVSRRYKEVLKECDGCSDRCGDSYTIMYGGRLAAFNLVNYQNLKLISCYVHKCISNIYSLSYALPISENIFCDSYYNYERSVPMQDRIDDIKRELYEFIMIFRIIPVESHRDFEKIYVDMLDYNENVIIDMVFKLWGVLYNIIVTRMDKVYSIWSKLEPEHNMFIHAYGSTLRDFASHVSEYLNNFDEYA